MLKLPDLQMGVRLSVLGRSRPEIIAAIVGGEEEAEGRLAVHRHHILRSLTGALKANFPVLCQVVDERFFAYAADAFIRMHPPSAPSLAEYGAEFPDFIRSFEAARTLPYLGDLARLEWAVMQARNAPDAAPIAADSLRQVPVVEYPNLSFRLDPSLTLLRTRWGVERIWAAHQGGEPAAQIDLGSEGSRLIVRRRGAEIEVERVDRASFAFLAALRHGRRLAEAGAAGLAADPFFDMAMALKRLLAEGALVGFSILPTVNRGASQP
jgi:hypothetical protein